MPSTIQKVYREQILPLNEKERLKLAALIINDIADKSETNGETGNNGGIRELFGSVSLGNPTGSDNESIDADLAREYGSTHEEG
ncbi:MAG: hypothetical protein H0X15_06970 [Acidobacteria bacterium]|jgi:hypothetical protein|nr:hypothetical protein [Acidobacteriota bacterium]MBA3785267.1 hypothetical protein [Acidobacteriota bacterium]